MLGGQRRLAPKVEVVVAAGEDTLHGVGGGVTGRGDPRLEAVAAEVVVIADQALEPPAPKVSLHTRVAGNSFMPGHDACKTIAIFVQFTRWRNRRER